MAIRKEIVWTVAEDGVTFLPAAPQYGGVQGEDNAVGVKFVLGAGHQLVDGGEYQLYIECEDPTGAYDKTEPLTPDQEGAVTAAVPLAWTQYGGTIRLNVAAEKEGEKIILESVHLTFHNRNGFTRRMQALIQTYIQKLLDTAAAVLRKAETAQKSAENSAATAATSAQGAQVAADAAETARKGAQEHAAATAENAEVASSAAKEANQHRASAESAKESAAASASSASAAATAAGQHREVAESAKKSAAESASSAATAAATAAQHQAAAESAKDSAAESADAAETARKNAAGAVTKASAYVTQAENSADAAATSAAEAKQAAADALAAAGADLLFVTVDEQGTASHTSAEIGEHIRHGGMAMLDYNGEFYALTFSDGIDAIFASFRDDPNAEVIYVLPDGRTVVEDRYFDNSGQSGSNLLVVHYDRREQVSHTSTQIFEHIQNGGTAIMSLDGSSGVTPELWSLMFSCPDWAVFGYITPDEPWCSAVEICSDGTVCVYGWQIPTMGLLQSHDITQLQNWTDAQKAIARNNIGVSADNIQPTLVIRFDSSTGQVDMTAEEIYDHVSHGGMAMLLDIADGWLYTLDYAKPDVTQFSCGMADDYIGYVICVQGDTGYITELATASAYWASKINESLGDIDTALDSIIAIQEELIGTIAFSDGFHQFKALKGMTFGEWVNSQYNTIGATVNAVNHIWWPEDNSTLGQLDGTFVTPTDVILDGAEYEWL